jgi:hypothetical protein
MGIDHPYRSLACPLNKKIDVEQIYIYTPLVSGIHRVHFWCEQEIDFTICWNNGEVSHMANGWRNIIHIRTNDEIVVRWPSNVNALVYVERV